MTNDIRPTRTQHKPEHWYRR